jgi:hypothetical protein
MTLAFTAQKAGSRGFDKAFAVDVARSVFPRCDNEDDQQYRRRVEEAFANIEANCGLLKFEDGQYDFWHLTFQEFLCARFIVDHETDYVQAIRDYWDNDRYREVIELYISYLSIDNKRWANEVVKTQLNKPDTAPFNRWRLAARALLNIHESRRDPEVLKRARVCLEDIIGTDMDARALADVGETLGWLGDRRDLKEFVKIEGGQYNLKGLRKVSLQAFEIGKYPVTNQWYEEFIKAEGYKNELFWTQEGWKWLNETGSQEPVFWHDRRWKCPNSPVVGVSRYEADAFCRWLSITRDGYTYRLPTEQEWQAAAAGKEGREHPWGPWQKNRCNTDESGIGRTSAVGIFAKGKTPDGVADLAGNIWECTCSDYESRKQSADFTPEKLGPVLRGGSWSFTRVFARCSYRYGYFPLNRFLTLGFRCARIK